MDNQPNDVITNASIVEVPKNDSPVVCVFCGASSGTAPSHMAAARALATAFHESNITLVYGGGTTGIMGELARSLVKLSGPSSVIGIIPAALVAFEQSGSVPEAEKYGQTIIVNSMHTRKQLMARHVIAGGKGSGFVALTGGYGTLEELMEVTTWNQLGIHNVGIVVFNINGYYDGLLQWVRGAVSAGFISEPNGKILVEAKEAEEVIKSLRDYVNSKGRMNLEWTTEG
ncbi:hypothetical protein BT63DRAFT_452520 [Microthyrium microscopicum]|uniref:Lysine decarboxylase-like protein-like protein n=1 Tax=Microthyrium microscopicum TaxID=703497 RepID=A0A6A6UII5_9PEZI|nr:hypothetical protein BT63DRAFT_452520 [Microthyrium microscopicum]